MTHRTSASATLGLFVVAALLGACGGENLGQQEVPGVAFGDNLEDNTVRLEPPSELKRQGPVSTFGIRSTGESPLKLTKLELKNVPDRITYKGEETETSCEFGPSAPDDAKNGACSSGTYCNVLSGHCHRATLPGTPLTVDPTVEFGFQLKASEQAELICPDPPSEKPDFVASTAAWNRIKSDYCGEMRIETNTRKDSQYFKGGNTRIYLLADTGSGQIKLEPGSLSFTDVKPGTEKTAELTVLNNGEGTLTVEGIDVDSNPEFFEISPGNFPIDIEADDNKTWEVKLDLSDVEDEEEIPTTSSLSVRSSAANSRRGGKNVGISIDKATAGPAIRLIGSNGKPKTDLSFADNETQTLRIDNTGTELLTLTNFSFEPFCPNYESGSCGQSGETSELENAYSVKLGGVSVEPDNNLRNTYGGDETPRTIETDEEPRSFEIEFTGDSGSPPPLGYLVLSHADESIGGKSYIALLGPRNGPLLEVLPGQFNFRHVDSEQKRTLLIRNRGTSKAELNPPPDQGEDGLGPNYNVVDPNEKSAPWTVPAGGLKRLQVVFNGAPKSDEVKAKTGLAFEAAQNSNQPVQKNPVAFNVSASKSQPEAAVTVEKPSRTLRVGDVVELSANVGTGTGSTYQWFVLKRPADSFVFRTRPFEPSGESFTIRPDQTGSYEVGVTVFTQGNGEAQHTTSMQIESKASSNGGNGNGNNGNGGNGNGDN